MNQSNPTQSSSENSNPQGSSQVPFPASNVAFGNVQPQLLNPFMLAAIAMANQQMAQSMQANTSLPTHQPNMPFNVQANTTSAGGQPTTAAETNGANAPSAPQPVPSNPVQQLPFPFPPQNPFVAALLGGGFLPGQVALANPAPGAAAALTTSSSINAPPNAAAIQHLVNKGDFVSDTPGTETKARKRPRKKKLATETVQPVAQNVPRSAVAAAAAAQVLAAHGAFPTLSSGAAMPNAVFSNLQNLTLKQLGEFVHVHGSCDECL